jgi:hypothetical protein
MTIEEALDRIDTVEFFLPTAIASGAEHLNRILTGTEEVRTLLQSSQDAIPAMIARLDTPGGVRQSTTLTTYFLVFLRANDARTLPALTRYIATISDEDKQRALAPGHPFQNAKAAIEALGARVV